jgi:hypothetical protein
VAEDRCQRGECAGGKRQTSGHRGVRIHEWVLVG